MFHSAIFRFSAVDHFVVAEKNLSYVEKKPCDFHGVNLS